jgi:cytochrome b subunit of formate dehydrogenase
MDETEVLPVRRQKNHLGLLFHPLRNDDQIPRHAFPARVFHNLHLVLYAILLFSGLQYYLPLARGAGFLWFPVYVHRAAGLALVAMPWPYLLMHRRRVLVFLNHYISWRKTDLLWLWRFPAYFLFPAKIRLPETKDKINAGQKLVGGLLIAVTALMGISGLLRLAATLLPPVILLRAQLLHQIALLPLIALLAGHILVGSGIHPRYRGVWRSMFGGGKLTRQLAREHWPVWLSRVEKYGPAKSDPGPSPRQARRLVLAAAAGTLLTAALFLVSFAPPRPWETKNTPTAEAFTDGVYIAEWNGREMSVTVQGGRVAVIRLRDSLTPTGLKQGLIRALAEGEHK